MTTEEEDNVAQKKKEVALDKCTHPMANRRVPQLLQSLVKTSGQMGEIFCTVLCSSCHVTMLSSSGKTNATLYSRHVGPQ